MICQELGQDRDFNTLYLCAQSAKPLADPALRYLYLFHDQSAAFIQSEEEVRARSGDYTTRVNDINALFRRWTNLWRSIILSTFEARTYKPYCRYLRMLDFRNLASMLEDSKLVGPIKTAFFANPLKQFYHEKTEYFRRHDSSRKLVDVVPTVNAIGDAVAANTYMVEDIAGDFSADSLTKWIAWTPRLQSLVLWRGDAVEEGVAKVIKENCEDFKAITIHDHTSPDADSAFADFLLGLNANTLAYFYMISFSNLQEQSFKGLAYHGESLKELKLGTLPKEGIEKLNALKGCVNIEVLLLEDATKSTRLEALHNDVFEEVVDWLSACKNLRDVTLKGFVDGAAILARVLSSPTVKLNKLSLEGYTVRQPEAVAFHTALPEQQELEFVSLKGDGSDTTDTDLTIMVEALCNMRKLRELELKDVSDELRTEHIAQLATALPLLEEFWVSGEEVDERILPMFAQMEHLRSLTLYALTKFDTVSIVDFIGMLREETQQGFWLNLMAQDPRYNIPEEEQELIRSMLREKLGGRFDFVLWREDEAESDSEDD